MDPNLQTILLGLLINGLTAFIAQLGRKDSKLLLGKELLEKIKWEETALQPILQKAAQTLAENIEWKRIPTMEITCLFLRSPEAEAIIRQIYAVKLSAEKEEKHNLASIRREFLTSFYLYTTAYSSYSELREEQLEDSSYILLDSLIEGCEKALNEAIDEGKLSAHEAKSSFRHRIILDELSALKENLTFLSSRQRPDLKDIFAFEEAYRRQVADRYKYITPPNFDKVRKFPIDKLYVTPSFTLTSKESQEGDTSITDSYDKILRGTFRSVLLGNPGGGKSTFTHKLCYELATNYPNRFFAGRQGVTPINVVLRDYGAEKKIHNCSILDFIKLKANEDFQIEPPIGAFEYLLLNGRAIVIFDGLDELLETSHRQEVSNAVESFCTAYPSVPVLVTSREIGYEQAPLDEERFEILRLTSFSSDQVKEYVHKWFNTTEGLSPNQRAKKIEDFLFDSQIVPDLRSNPLMLALLCNIYQEENYIPKNRPDVYERCAIMLFERWDTSRGIKALLPFESQIRPAMMYLAYWIYSQEGLRSGVTENKLVEKTTEYLCEKLYEDRDEAARAAREFIGFCKGRAWVFTNMGSTKNEELYHFTHQTFLEYFTSAYLFRTHSTPRSMFIILRPRIAKREWDAVAQLAFQIQNKQVEGAGDKLLTALIKEAYKSQETKKWNFLSFAVRCLSFIIPSPKTLQYVTSACIEFSLKYVTGRSNSSLDNDESLEEIFSNLLGAATENLKSISNHIERVIIERVNNAPDTEAQLALELGLTLSSFHFFNVGLPDAFKRSRSTADDQRDFWEGVSSRILASCTDRAELLCQQSLIISHLVIKDKKARIDYLIKWHGVDSIFRNCRYKMRHRVSRSSIIEQLNHALWQSRSEDDTKEAQRIGENLSLLRELGDKLLTCPPPWTKEPIRAQTNTAFLFRTSSNQKLLEQLNRAKNSQFGLFIFYAISWEINKHFREKVTKEAASQTNRTKDFFPNLIIALLEARNKTIEESNSLVEIDECSFTDEQKKFVWRWIRREINLVQSFEPIR